MDPELLRDIIHWDIVNWSRALEYWDQVIQWSGATLNCLELGSWQGGLSVWLALKGNHVVCSDLRGIAERAEPLVKKYRLEQRIRYEHIDATNIPYENHFDIVAFKSVLGGIGRNGRKTQEQVLQQIHKALKPGGRLLFAENLTGSFIHSLFRKAFVSWGREWRYVTVEEMREFLSRFSSVQLETGGIAGTFGRNEAQQQLLSKLDRAFLNKITPAGWKYIVYGVAEK